MRVVIGTFSLARPGGTETYVLTVARELQRLGPAGRGDGDRRRLSRGQAVVGAASMVRADVPAQSVVAGSPARPLRPVRADELIEAWQDELA